MELCNLVSGDAGKEWLRQLVLLLPGLVSHEKCKFARPLVEGVAWFVKSEVVLKKFHLFEQFCLALVSLESEFLPVFINYFLERLRATAH